MRHARRNSILIHLAAIVVAVFILLPFGWMVIASVTPQRILISTPLQWIPDTLDWSRYDLIFRGGAESVGATFRAALANTTIVAVGTVAVSMIVGILGAYAFARLRFRFRQAVLILFLATYMLPQIALLIPLYLILNSLGLLDTVTGLIIVDCSLVVPFVLWILSNYFLTIPEELEEAARIDGAGSWTVFWRIILPLLRPVIATATIMVMLFAWSDIFYAFFVLGGGPDATLPLNLYQVASAALYLNNWHLIFAYVALMSLPMVVVFVVAQRRIISGITSGAVK